MRVTKRYLLFTKLERTSLSEKENVHTRFENTSPSVHSFWWRCGQGSHPYTSRTRWLRPDRPMVLYWRRYGRVGGCQIDKKGWMAIRCVECSAYGMTVQSVRRWKSLKRIFTEYVPWKLHIVTMIDQIRSSQTSRRYRKISNKKKESAQYNAIYWESEYQKVKIQRAQGGCLGTKSRRKTW